MKDPPAPPGSAQPPRNQTCQHTQQCPDARAPDRIAAQAVASHPEEGWSLREAAAWDQLAARIGGSGS
jgi:Family of unknown function (DUF5999)